MTLPERREDLSEVWRRQLVSSALISAHVPFLSLEKIHVQQCIREVLHETRYSTSERETEALVTKVVDKMTYFPEPIKRFSRTGCKDVREKIYQELEIDLMEQ
ncbi:torsin-2A-like [Dreissena polymorpha]|uniref:Torsin-1A C-terminal domain-containing protein n=1 Tax=Dreissena polymorpha TaxID=45954 RepID=A0A9D4FGG4_DREPO|nr:torsin-2A-like [Dreissena polymorpha]KAH3797491.1 hypothetical protein DPMN_151072 [Dreissena polymorpha]